MFNRAIQYLRRHGAKRTAVRLVRIAAPERVADFAVIDRQVRRRRGIEIGGPTRLFEGRQLVPIYPLVGALDNVNFSAQTVWEGQLEEGPNFRFDRGRRTGHQYLREAGDLGNIPDSSYDFLASSHTLEHLANPLKALREWQRVVRPGGGLLLVVPHKEGTFDHRRPVTTLQHMIEDQRRGVGEDDATHLSEILAMHDLTRDPGAGDAEAFGLRSLRNLENRCLHHHVFTSVRLAEVLDHVGLRILMLDACRPYHIVAFAQRPDGQAGSVSNGPFFRSDALFRRRSPFVSDKLDA